MNIKKMLLGILAATCLSATALAQQPIGLYIDNKKAAPPQPPVIQNGTTLVPMRTIFEGLGAEVDWDAKSQTVIGKSKDKTVRLTIDKNSAAVNGKEYPLAVPAALIEGTTFVPARFVAESLGAKVDWDPNTQSVLVNSDFPYGSYPVVRVVDGDTFIVQDGKKEERVRLIGVDTPESVHPDVTKNLPAGKIASSFTEKHLTGRTVALELDTAARDRYGRLLAYAWLDGEMYNRTLLTEGYAQPATYPPNVRYADEFAVLSAKAREKGVGLWAGSEAQPVPKEVSQSEATSKETIQQTENTLHVRAGEYAFLSMEGTPGQTYRISVFYTSGASKAEGLEAKAADSDGQVSWRWRVGNATKPGNYSITITGDKTDHYSLVVE